MGEDQQGRRLNAPRADSLPCPVVYDIQKSRLGRNKDYRDMDHQGSLRALLTMRCEKLSSSFRSIDRQIDVHVAY